MDTQGGLYAESKEAGDGKYAVQSSLTGSQLSLVRLGAAMLGVPPHRHLELRPAFPWRRGGGGGGGGTCGSIGSGAGLQLATAAPPRLMHGQNGLGFERRHTLGRRHMRQDGWFSFKDTERL